MLILESFNSVYYMFKWVITVEEIASAEWIHRQGKQLSLSFFASLLYKGHLF